MILKEEEGKTIYFRKTKMVFKAMLDQTGNRYTSILMTHPGNVGPAMHIHPDGPETFFVIEGQYTFTLDGQTWNAGPGDFVYIPANSEHNYKSGSTGGKMLVTTPPNVETYFLHIADKLLSGEVPLEEEFNFAAQHGQVFTDKSGHWGHI